MAAALNAFMPDRVMRVAKDRLRAGHSNSVGGTMSLCARVTGHCLALSHPRDHLGHYHLLKKRSIISLRTPRSTPPRPQCAEKAASVSRFPNSGQEASRAHLRCECYLAEHFDSIQPAACARCGGSIPSLRLRLGRSPSLGLTESSVPACPSAGTSDDACRPGP